MLTDDKLKAHRRRERLRRRFLPAQVRLLFIGESPPASGRFFYRGDSGLYRAVRDTFQAVDSSVSDAGFLNAFRAAGCYLIDLCPEPVDHLELKLRRSICRVGEAPLSRIIERLHPLEIVTVVRRIEANVSRAALRACWQGPFLHLPYPARWARFRDVFVETLKGPVAAMLLRPVGSTDPLGRSVDDNADNREVARTGQTTSNANTAHLRPLTEKL